MFDHPWSDHGQRFFARRAKGAKKLKDKWVGVECLGHKQRFTKDERKKEIAWVRVKHYHSKKQIIDLQKKKIQHVVSKLEVIMDEHDWQRLTLTIFYYICETLQVCLGLPNRKLVVKKVIINKEVFTNTLDYIYCLPS